MQPSQGNVGRAAIALGSNLGDRARHLESAVAALARLPGTWVRARAAPIETEPVGPPGQGPYLNSAVVIATRLAPRPLLEALLAIEREHGRERSPGQRWGPRTLDLDLLLFDDLQIHEPGLVVPHPRLQDRAFVLAPLSEIAADWPVPGLNATVGELWARLRAASA